MVPADLAQRMEQSALHVLHRMKKSYGRQKLTAAATAVKEAVMGVVAKAHGRSGESL